MCLGYCGHAHASTLQVQSGGGASVLARAERMLQGLLGRSKGSQEQKEKTPEGAKGLDVEGKLTVCSVEISFSKDSPGLKVFMKEVSSIL